MLTNTPKAGQDMLLPKLAGDMIRGSKSGQIGLYQLHQLPSRQKLNNPTQQQKHKYKIQKDKYTQGTR